jgi:hypothetical protein
MARKICLWPVPVTIDNITPRQQCLLLGSGVHTKIGKFPYNDTLKSEWPFCYFFQAPQWVTQPGPHGRKIPVISESQVVSYITSHIFATCSNATASSAHDGRIFGSSWMQCSTISCQNSSKLTLPHSPGCSSCNTTPRAYTSAAVVMKGWAVKNSGPWYPVVPPVLWVMETSVERPRSQTWRRGEGLEGGMVGNNTCSPSHKTAPANKHFKRVLSPSHAFSNLQYSNYSPIQRRKLIVTCLIRYGTK